MNPLIPGEFKQNGIVISPTDWLVVISTENQKELFPLEMSAVFIGGFASDPIHLNDALIMFGKGSALEGFRRHSRKPITELVQSWSLLAQSVKRKIFIIEELCGRDEDSFGMRALYTVTTDGKAGFFLSRNRMHLMRPAR